MQTRIRIACLILATALTGTVMPAVAQGVQPLPPIVSPGELQNFQNIQRRQAEQQQMQIRREIDRQIIIQTPPPKQEVPVVRPSCQLPVNGSASTC